ncbi:Zinc transporter ZupT [Limihaloglobus sulfuriphilus]|uniref:Zinc transporter ZupT n=2 Tax=Limihaloglobus sulfuriphilus TaxID=1851148 RepID=A0A1Q2MGH8_9BACT|nr:Zinc transporter ZupT [Limihaloglobus sulfuriphilus]
MHMLTYLQQFNPVFQALVGGCFTWGVTALGAAAVFCTLKVNKKLMDFMLGFAAGVMIAASFWSLLAPAIEMSKELPIPSWVPAAVGFFLGGLVLRLIDMVLPHLHGGLSAGQAEGIKTSWQRTTLLVLAITLHNIPEGLAVGVAFGAASAGLPSATLIAAVALTIGIGLQNFPEGLAVSMALRREGISRFRAFWYGQLSGLVEPIAAVAGVLAVVTIKSILPYSLAFAAGAMIFVVIEDVVPESQRHGNIDLATGGAMIGFIVMMILDVALG